MTTEPDLRSRLIERIYDIALAPDRYDAFMEDWERHIAAIAEGMTDLQSASGLHEDPVLESHFQRAFGILERLGRGQFNARTGDEPNNRITVRRDGSVVSDSADASGSAGIRTVRDVAALFADDDGARFSTAFANLKRAPRTGHMEVVHLAAGQGPVFATLSTARDEASGEVVLRIEPLELIWDERLAAILQSSFGLSVSELRVVEGLAAGHDLAALSGNLDKSLNTLRTQLKAVFHKTRTGSQAELIRSVTMLSMLVKATGNVSTPAAVAPVDPGTLRPFALPDGRLMPVHFIGPEDGTPIVFVHGMLDGIAVTKSIAENLHRTGLRFIAPERPNFGGASADLRKREAPDVFACDLSFLAEKLGIASCIVAGHMAGSLYAFAAAAQCPGLVRGVATISGGVPIRSVNQFATMSARQRTVAYTARFAPALLPAILRAGIAQIDSVNALDFMNALYPPGTPDRQVTSDPAIAAAIVDGYRYAVAQGHHAFEIDTWHVTRDWTGLVTASDCPVLIMHGSHDPVVDIGSVRAFAAMLGARARLEEHGASGQLLFYSDPERVLDALATLASECGCNSAKRRMAGAI